MGARALMISLAAAAALGWPPSAFADPRPVAPFTETWSIDGRDVVVHNHGDPLEALSPAWPAPAAGGTTLPTTWCGAQTAADDVVNETGSGSDHKIKVVEAVPSDREPSAEVRDGIQASVAAMVQHIADESGGKRSLRFDLGTSCGETYVDILTLRLPRTAAEYGAGACNTGPLFGDARASMPSLRGVRNIALFAPTIRCGAIAGYAQAPSDDRDRSDNAANRGGYYAVTFYLEGRTALHEIGHNLGAVQASALHHDGGRHCWDNDDTMCYPYTTLLPQSPLRPCSQRNPEPFDCGKDDYFSATPAPGSYLDTHWNLYDSAFMCDVATCVPRPADAPPADPVEPAPAAPAAPPPAPDSEDSGGSPAPSSSAPFAADDRPAARRRCSRGRVRSRGKCVRRAACRTAKQRRAKRCRSARARSRR